MFATKTIITSSTAGNSILTATGDATIVTELASYTTVNLVKFALWTCTTLLLQVTSINGFSYFVATSAPLPVASFTQLTVQSFASNLVGCQK